MSDLVERLRDKTRLRKIHGLTGWVLHEEALTSNAANAIEHLTAERDHSRYEVAQYAKELGLAEDAAAMLEQQVLDLTAVRGWLRENRDYWMKAAQEAQTHRDGANLQLELIHAELAEARAERDRLAKENVELCQRVNTLQNRLWVSDWNATISQLACAQSPESLDAALQEKRDE